MSATFMPPRPAVREPLPADLRYPVLAEQALNECHGAPHFAELMRQLWEAGAENPAVLGAAIASVAEDFLRESVQDQGGCYDCCQPEGRCLCPRLGAVDD